MDNNQLYQTANEALNEIMFSGRYEGRPVYFAIDDHMRKFLAQKLNKDESEVEYFIAEIVGSKLNKNGDPYHRYVNLTKDWNKLGRYGKPQFTAILFALSFAASLMAGDNNYSSSNYYERLSQILHVPKDRLSANGKSTETFWKSLNLWLSENDYEYGRPTAQPINTNRYISYAQSQAVVRDGDRYRFHHLFEKYGFSGNEKFSNEEIEIYLSSWIYSSSSNSRLKAAWLKTQLRPIFCGVVLAELEAWSEETREQAGGNHERDTSQSLSLALSVVPSFPKPNLTLLLGRSTIIADPIEKLFLERTEDELVLSNNTYGGFASLSPNVVRRSNTILFDKIEVQDSTGAIKFNWKPRLIIPFKKTLDGAFSVEVSRVNAAINHDVLVRDKPSIREKVDEYITAHSNQKSRVATADEIKGIPPGWVLYRDVFIMPHDDEISDNNLQVLKPLRSKTSLMFEGGINLGNNIWHGQKPPSMQIMSGSEEVRLSIYKLDQEMDTPLMSQSGPRFCQIPSLKLEILGDGEYTIQSRFGKKHVSNLGVNFRSADRPRPLHLKMSFPYCDVSGVGLEPSEPDSIKVEGFNVYNLTLGAKSNQEAINSHQDLPNFEKEDWQPSFLSQLESLSEPRSCVGRGYHVWLCDTLEPGLPRSTPLNMECKDCRESVLTRDRGIRARCLALG